MINDGWQGREYSVVLQVDSVSPFVRLEEYKSMQYNHTFNYYSPNYILHLLQS